MLKEETNEREPDIDAINEAHYISAMTRIQDEKKAKELGMTYEQFLKERDEMIENGDWLETAAKNDLW